MCFVGESKLWQQDWEVIFHWIKRFKNPEWWNVEIKLENGEHMLGPLTEQLSDILSNTYAH